MTHFKTGCKQFRVHPIISPGLLLITCCEGTFTEVFNDRQQGTSYSEVTIYCINQVFLKCLHIEGPKSGQINIGSGRPKKATDLDLEYRLQALVQL